MSRPKIGLSRALKLALARIVRHDGPVNTASQDLPRHLDLLQQKLQHPTNEGGTEIARFRVTGDLAGNPKHN